MRIAPTLPVTLALVAALALSIAGACGPAAGPPPSTNQAASATPAASAEEEQVAEPPTTAQTNPPPDEPPPAAEQPAPPADPAPWAADRIAKKEVPRVFLTEHRKAENRAGCPLLVPTDLGAGAGAKPRRASFHGGWAVAYDKKGLPGTKSSGDDCDDCGRSAFGVAGAGVTKGGGPAWPHEIVWADGSRAGYGPEGGAGARQLAFVEAADAECLYNVWSSLGEEHLLVILRGLRRVAE